MKKKILVLGASGLVGSHFSQNSSDYILALPTSSELDITNEKNISEYLNTFNPEWIINFAAFTNVDEAELERGNENGPVWQKNYLAVKNILSCFKSKNYIQISTNMVFPGDLSFPGPYAEDDTLPQTSENLTWYGWSKNRAEALVTERGGVILRINHPVRVEQNYKPDVIRNLLQKISEKKISTLFNDQQIAISYIPEITKTLKLIIEQEAYGTYHCSSDTTTPYELLSWTLKELGSDFQLGECSVKDSEKYKQNPNRYPLYGGLKVKKTEDLLETHFATWQTIVEYLIGSGLKLPK